MPKFGLIRPQYFNFQQNLFAACIAVSCAFIVQTMSLVAIPIRALELGASPAFVGIILSAPYLLPLIFAIPLGTRIATVGERKMILLGAVGLVIGPISALIVPGFLGLVLLQVLTGVSQMVMMLAAQSVVAGLGTGRASEKHFGWYTTCISGGQLIGPIMAGWLIDRVSVQLAFGIMLLIALICLGSGSALTRQERVVEHFPISSIGYSAQGRLLLENSGVQLSIIVTVAVIFALSAYGNFLPVYLKELSFSATAIGWLVSLRALSAMLIRPFTSAMTGLVGGRARTMAFCVVIVAVGVMCIGFTKSPAVLILLAMLIGLGSGISQPLSLVVLSDHVHVNQRPGALGMRLMSNRGAQFLAPVLFGILVQATGFAMTFLLVGLILFFCWLLILFMTPGFARFEKGEHADN